MCHQRSDAGDCRQHLYPTQSHRTRLNGAPTIVRALILQLRGLGERSMAGSCLTVCLAGDIFPHRAPSTDPS
jgi:hypothetical protein